MPGEQEEPRAEQIYEYLRWVEEAQGGGYVEQVDDVYYHVQVEAYKEREADETLVPEGTA